MQRGIMQLLGNLQSAVNYRSAHVVTIKTFSKDDVFIGLSCKMLRLTLSVSGHVTFVVQGCGLCSCLE